MVGGWGGCGAWVARLEAVWRVFRLAAPDVGVRVGVVRAGWRGGGLPFEIGAGVVGEIHVIVCGRGRGGG